MERRTESGTTSAGTDPITMKETESGVVSVAVGSITPDQGTTAGIQPSSNVESGTTTSVSSSSSSVSITNGSTTIGTTYITTTQHVEIPTDRDTTVVHTTQEFEHGPTTGFGVISSVPEPRTEPPTTRAPIHQPPQYPTMRSKPKGGRINSEAEERTAMIIGIVAGALIAVILVILLVLWFKSNGDQNYKTEHEKSHGYGQGPNAALLGPGSRANDTHHHSTNGSTMPLNGSLRNGHDKSNNGMGGVGLVPPKPKKRDSKDIKEWYV